MSYMLYHTLNKNLKTTPMSKAESEKLKKKLSGLNEESKRAIILLIIEHSRVVDDFSINIEKLKLPYGMKQKNSDIEINMDKLPQPLKWVLWKFVKP